MPEETVTVDATEQTQSTNEAVEETTLLGQQQAEEKKTVEEGQEESQKEESAEGKEESTESSIPETYEFNLPEGMELDQEALGKFTPIFKELELTQEKAQKLVDVYVPYANELAQKQHDAGVQAFNEMKENWKAETKKAYGNDLQKSMATASKAIDKFGGKELRQILEDSGYGNHKAMVDFFVNVGKKISEDSFPDSNSSDSSVTIDPNVLYPTMKQ